MGHYTKLFADLYLDNDRTPDSVKTALEFLINGTGAAPCDLVYSDEDAALALEILREKGFESDHPFFNLPGIRGLDGGMLNSCDRGVYDRDTGHIHVRTMCLAYDQLYPRFLDWVSRYLDPNQRQVAFTQGEDEYGVIGYELEVRQAFNERAVTRDYYAGDDRMDLEDVMAKVIAGGSIA